MAEVAERLHVDEDAVLDLSLSDINSATPEAADREILGNIAPNSAERKGPVELAPRKTRGKKKGRAAAEAETEPAVEEEAEAEQEQDGEVNIYVDPEVEAQEEHDEETNIETETADEDLDATTNETMERLAKLRITSLASQAPATPEVEQDSSTADITKATETTAKTSEDTELEQSTKSTATSPTKEAANALPKISIAIPPQQQELEESELDDQTAFEAPSSPLATAMPKVIKSLRTDTPGKRSTSNKENVEPVEPINATTPASTVDSPEVQPSPASQQTPLDDAVTQPVTSPSTSHISNDKKEDPVETLDILDEAVDKTKPEVPEALVPSGKTQTEKPTGEAEKPKKAKPVPVVRLTKAAAARLSMAQGANTDASKAPASTRPRPSIMPARAGNVRQSVVPAASSKRIPPTTSNAKAPATKTSPRSKKETVIPHSKPRPVSLSFPTPPPAAKSSKAPTKSTFQLPGEAVAAKLKAAREERAKREATAAASKDEKRPAFKARPVPNTLNKTPSVRHTAASRARDPAKAGEVAPKPSTSTSTTTTGHKRSNTISTSKPRPSTVPSSSSATTKPSAPSTLTVQKRPRPSSMHVSSTTASAATAAPAPRNPSISSSSGAASRPSTARITSGASSKGKEVYARFGAARDAAENEKREKEDAARKARAAAAEKGRAASREWAEKQRVKKMVARVEGMAGA